MGPLIVGAHRGAGKFRSSQLGKCEWPCGTRRLLPRAEMRASMKGPAERGGHRDEKVPLRTWPAGHRSVHRSRNHRHRQPRRRWLWRDVLWAVLFSVAATVILQDMAARVGLAGRRGLAEAIRDSLDNRRIRVGVLGLITVTILVGNAAFQTGNLIGASLGLSLLSGLPQEALALVVGGLAAGLLLTGTYQTIQNALVCLVGLMSIVFCAVAGLTAPDIGDLIAGVLIPRLPPGSLLTVLALIGTTFVSYNLFLHASTALERWPDASRNDENIRESRRDTVFSVVLGGLITATVVVAASPLLGQGADAANAAAVAERLEPLLGRAAPVFFGLGLFAAGLTSAITAPLAAAYAAGGALGWPPDLRSGRFRLLWGFVLATGVFCAVALGGSPYYVILLAQAGNGLVLPLTLILLLMVANKTRIMGTHRNSRLTNVLGVIVVLVISWLALLQLARVLGRAG